ncbi:MAG: STAS domain-containing protein [Acidimicrobiales bacterium]
MSAATAGSPTRPTAAGSDVPDSMTESPDINVTSDGTAVVIAVAGGLDQSTGQALIDAATAAVATGPSHLDIDLRGLGSFTDEGARALVTCRTLGSELPGGLHYRTSRGPGREALLSAYRELETDGLAD